MEHALALFDKVVDCWYKYLLGTGDEGMGMSEAQLQEVRPSFGNMLYPRACVCL